MAMAEAYGLSDYKLLRRYAQHGINYLESHRNPYGVWRYQPRDNDNDSSVTSWCIHAYAAAKRAGLYCVAVPNELTKNLPFPPVDLRLDSLADMPLEMLLAQLV